MAGAQPFVHQEDSPRLIHSNTTRGPAAERLPVEAGRFAKPRDRDAGLKSRLRSSRWFRHPPAEERFTVRP
jgi:hypothetical protein